MKKEMNKKEDSKFFRNKKAQGIMGMGFGTIFSIILIILFVVIAFMVIRAVLNSQKCAQVNLFVEDFRNDVKTIWNGGGDREIQNQNLPKGIEFVCFANLTKPITARGVLEEVGFDLTLYEGTNSNIFLYPEESACNRPYYQVEHLDLDKITSESNPKCFVVEDGKVKIRVKLGINERLVSLE